MLSEKQIRINEFSYEDYVNWIEYSTEDSIPELRNHDIDFHLINYIYMIERCQDDLTESQKDILSSMFIEYFSEDLSDILEYNIDGTWNDRLKNVVWFIRLFNKFEFFNARSEVEEKFYNKLNNETEIFNQSNIITVLSHLRNNMLILQLLIDYNSLFEKAEKFINLEELKDERLAELTKHITDLEEEVEEEIEYEK